MRIVFIALILGSTLLTLTSCATLRPQTQYSSWSKREQALSQIKRWDLQGAIAFRTAHESGSASLYWVQQPGQYTISLFAPLGAGSMILTVKPNWAEVTLSDGKKYRAANPETLLAQQTHWRLPVSYLHYWIRGLPVPQIPSQTQFDSNHRLTELTQQGWHIQFLRYDWASGIEMPTKLVVSHPPIQVKVVITEWGRGR